MAQSLKENVYRAIQERALGGKLLPGSRVSEVLLAKEFGISRTPVREAISQLVHEGLVEQIPNEGTFMKKPTRTELEDLYQLRQWVESGAVAEAARLIGPKQIAQLEAACAEGLAIGRDIRLARQGARRTDVIMDRCVKADLAFHMTLIQVSGNLLAMKTVGENHILSRVWASTPDFSPDLHVQALVYRDHARILRYVKQGDAEGAARAMTIHIQRGREQALRWFDLSQRRQAAGLGPYTFWPDYVLRKAERLEERKTFE